MEFDWKIGGALGFGALIGWYVYYINRYRKADVQISDMVTLIGAIGGAAVLALFPKGSELFGSYGVGLAVGFFGYFIVLVILVGVSKNFDMDWFLDGRRKNPADGWGYGPDNQQPVRPMMAPDLPPSVVHNFYGIAPAQAMALASPLTRSFAAIDPTAQRIIDTCVAVWSDSNTDGVPYQNACNFFAIEVTRRLSVTLTGVADDIVNQIKGAGWTQLTDGPAARDAAAQGRFVVAGLKAADFQQPRSEGHVAIVVAGAMNGSGWAPAGYWGSTDAGVRQLGGGGIPISNCFRAEDGPNIVYACRSL